MGDTQIISETSISTYQLKEELENIKKRDKELNFRSNRMEEYLQQISTVEKADELLKKLTKLDIPRLKEQHIHKIMDIMPVSVNELKILLQSYTLTLNNDAMKKIVDTVNEFSEKK
jgi:DNA-directed RNA polymerase subunit F